MGVMKDQIVIDTRVRGWTNSKCGETTMEIPAVMKYLGDQRGGQMSAVGRTRPPDKQQRGMNSMMPKTP